MNRRKLFAISILLLLACMPFSTQAQKASSLKISEVVIENVNGIVDEYGVHAPWIEICNTSWGTVNLRNCYLTTNRGTLNKNLSVDQRVSMMSMIPRGDDRTELNAQERIVFFADGKSNRGTLHTSPNCAWPNSDTALQARKEGIFIALFDGDGHTLLDSVTVPATLKQDYSYARFLNKGGKTYRWLAVAPQDVTPRSPNEHSGLTDSKVQEFKKKDPHGFGMAILGMGIVFSCLVLLFLFFYFFGKMFVKHDNQHAPRKTVQKPAEKASETDDSAAVAAAIALALNDALGVVHDNESEVITIKSHSTRWKRTDS